MVTERQYYQTLTRSIRIVVARLLDDYSRVLYLRFCLRSIERIGDIDSIKSLKI